MNKAEEYYNSLQPRFNQSITEYEEDEICYEDEICGYECLGCGNIQESNGWGGECEKCMGKCLEPIYF